MPMKKADMEEHREQYHELMAGANDAQREGLYRKAVDLALASWDHVDGMMQYERKYQDREFDNVKGIEVILKYAPLLLDFGSLERLEALLKSCRRIERNTSHSLADKLSEARALLWDAHRMWDHIERHPGTRQDTLRRVIGGDQDRWRSVANAWSNMGLLLRTPEGGSYRLELSTRLGQVVPGKCSACGNVVEAPKAMFLEDLTCPECKATAPFAILSSSPAAESKE